MAALTASPWRLVWPYMGMNELLAFQVSIPAVHGYQGIGNWCNLSQEVSVVCEWFHSELHEWMLFCNTITILAIASHDMHMTYR